MRHSIPMICILLLVTACGSPKQSNQEEEETVANKEVTISEAAQTLLSTLQGEYFMLTEEGNEILFLESCAYNKPDVQIKENTEGSGKWELTWIDEPAGIADAKKDDSDIVITTDTDEIFVFYANDDNSQLWNFGSGGRATPPIVKAEELSQFKIKPCTDAIEIMKSMPSSWYALTSMDDKQVIYVECESATPGYDIGTDGKTIDFRSGSDPDIIISMSKANNVITITHQSAMSETVSPGTIKVNLESRNHYVQFDGRDHVSAEIQDYFDTVEEDCR